VAEQLFTIPVNEAFDQDCECPVCHMYQVLQQNAIDFTMGPSYMEDDVRQATNKMGFCEKHIKLLYKNQNRLGLALMMLSHTDRTLKDLEKLTKGNKRSPVGLFRKKDGMSALKTYTDKLNESCYICSRIDHIFERYVVTLFHLYQNEDEFRSKFKNSKGVCINHYALLYELAPQYLHGNQFDSFSTELEHLFYENMTRVRDELKWFIDKFDYRYVDEPWGNSRDALPRTIKKMNSTDIE